jgi:hypothetical protein
VEKREKGSITEKAPKKVKVERTRNEKKALESMGKYSK